MSEIFTLARSAGEEDVRRKRSTYPHPRCGRSLRCAPGSKTYPSGIASSLALRAWVSAIAAALRQNPVFRLTSSSGLLLFGMLLLFARIAPAADPTLAYLFPSGARRGTSVQITAKGTFPNWPMQGWVDRPGLTITPAEKQGELQVAVAEEAPPGVYLVRLLDKQGATPVQPFVVGTLPELLEQEPNDAPHQAQQLEGSATVNGRLAKGGDVDVYAIQLQQGQTLVASLEANTALGSPMDGVLQIVTPDGFLIGQNDDSCGVDPQLVWTVPADGTYLVRIFAFPAAPNSTIALAGADNFVYRLTITSGGFIDHSMPLAVRRGTANELQLFGWNIPQENCRTTLEAALLDETVYLGHASLAHAPPVVVVDHEVLVSSTTGDGRPQQLNVPSSVSGRIDEPRDVDTYRFQGVKGQKLSLRLESRSLGYPLDAVIRVVGPENKMLVEVDDVSRDQRDARANLELPEDGEYQIEVRDLYGHGGLRYVYCLTVEEARPDFRLTVASDTFVATAGQKLEIPVSIDRRDGFSGEIQITAEGLPEGVTVEPLTDTGSGSSTESSRRSRGRRSGSEAKLVLTVEAGVTWSGPFRVLGTSAADESARRFARYAPRPPYVSLAELWLTVKAE